MEIQGCLTVVDMSKDPPLVGVLKKKGAINDDDDNNKGTGGMEPIGVYYFAFSTICNVFN